MLLASLLVGIQVFVYTTVRPPNPIVYGSITPLFVSFLAAVLGVEVVVSIFHISLVRATISCEAALRRIVPLDGPGHGVVEEDHRGSDVEDLGAESSP